MTQQDIRRRPDGSIDIDFYREQGDAERRAAMRAFGRVLQRLPSLIRVWGKPRPCDGQHIVGVVRPLSRLASDPA